MVKYPMTGNKTYYGRYGKFDFSNINEGYIITWVYDDDPYKKFKIRLEKEGKGQNFSAHPAHNDTYIPMVFGSGWYNILILRNTTGGDYRAELNYFTNVDLINDLSPWLYPTCYVEYNKDSKCVLIGNDICKNCNTDFEKFKTIVNWVIDYMDYDHELARVVSNVDKFFIPNPDEAINKKKGICFEYSSLVAALCRSQGIPCKVTVGHVNRAYHAWNEIYLRDEGELVPGRKINSNTWTTFDVTMADGGGSINAFYEVADIHPYRVEYYG